MTTEEKQVIKNAARASLAAMGVSSYQIDVVLERLSDDIIIALESIKQNEQK